MSKRPARFQIKFSDTCSEPGCRQHNHWYFRVVASNGKILCHSQSYRSKAACRRGLEAVRSARAPKD